MKGSYKICKNCGREFLASSKDKMYCSVNCLYDARRKRKLPQHIFETKQLDPITDCPDDCVYKVKAGAIYCCDYFLVKGEKRGCKGGKDCKKYIKDIRTKGEQWVDRKRKIF